MASRLGERIGFDLPLLAAHARRDRPFWGFRRDDPRLAQAREGGVPMLAAEYVRQMRIIQGKGLFLLYGNCAGGYLTWETARQLLAAGEEIAGILFYEVPLRADFERLMPGVTPAHVSREWRLTLYYRPQPLPVALNHVMTDAWQARGWQGPWQQVVCGSHETAVIPIETVGARDFPEACANLVAERVRTWIEKSEARVRGA